jgi:glycogen operon protein
MLLHGDELGRSQNGNNNAYCQDNETTWLSWELNSDQQNFLQFARSAFRLRKSIRDFLTKTERSFPTYSVVQLSSYQAGNGDPETDVEGSSAPLAVAVELEAKRLLYILNASSRNLLVSLPSPIGDSKWKLLFASDGNLSSHLKESELQLYRHTVVVLTDDESGGLRRS